MGLLLRSYLNEGPDINMSTGFTDRAKRSFLPSRVFLRQQRDTHYHRAYYYVFLISIVLCWSPSKLLAYLAPWIAMFAFLFLTRSRSMLRNLIVVLSIWLLILPIYALLTRGFVFHSAVLSLLTYGAIIFIFVVPTKLLANVRLANRMLSIARWVLLIQGSWGIGQALASFARRGTFDGATGDAVAGTIRPFSVYPDFSNPMFAVNIALLLFCLLPQFYYERKGRFVFVVGLIALVLASVVHVLLFAAVAFLFAFTFYYPSFLFRKSGWLTLILFTLVAGFASLILSNNFTTLRGFIAHTIEGRTPRAQVVTRVLTEMPSQYPWMPVVGIGPGQFSSRAGLIGTGMYFGGPVNPRKIPFLPKGMSPTFRNYVLDLWLAMSFNPTVNDSSSSYKPFFSWLSVYVEYGAIAVLVIVGLIGKILWRLRRSMNGSSMRRLQATSLSAAIVFVFMLGVQENYWETSQALLVGLLMLKVLYANLAYGKLNMELSTVTTVSGGKLWASRFAVR